MCGIVGIYNNKYKNNKIEDSIKFLNTLQDHRGPDDSNYYVDKDLNFAMGSTRLAIQDIKNGAQPMYSRDKRYVIVYNGEIFNSPDLRSKLLYKGVDFTSSNSDTEVLLNKLIHDGLSSLSEINGMFAFAFYDTHKKKLILCRDKVGIKPLYLFRKNSCIIFSSEIRTIFSSKEFSKDLNLNSIYNFTSLMYIPNEETIFQNVIKVDPGTYIEIDLEENKIKKTKWFDLEFNINYKESKKFWIEKTNHTVNQSIKNSTISDVPFATLLSSGIDSSIIANCLNKNNVELNTHTLGFESNTIYKNINEIEAASNYARQLNSNHTSMIYKENLFRDELKNMVISMGEPYGGGLPSWAIFKSISMKYKMALSGTGADEIFGNYGKWKRLLPFQLIGQNINKKIFNKYLFDYRYYATDKIKKTVIFNEKFSNITETSELLFNIYNSCNSNDVRNKSAFLDFKTQLPNEFLLMSDHFSMAHSLEVRPPFLDNSMIDLFLTMPPNYRTSFFDLKKILKTAFKNELNSEILNSTKKGFVLPIRNWIKSHFYKDLLSIFDPKKLKKQDIFNHNLLDEYIIPLIKNENSNITSVWGLFMFQLWYNEFKI